METTKRTAKGLFVVEGWNGLECLWYFAGCQARSIQNKADRAILDYGATRVIVKRIGGDVVAECTDSMIWDVRDPWVAEHLR